jgi:nitroimidazol reductase NimA-like FMN-containing flavoprotein (pyridoxamine 5'-phosphate oxidase superfamily)
MPAKSYSQDTRSNISSLPTDECFGLLAVATVGRVGFVSPAGVQIIPVNYRLGQGHRLFLRVVPRGVLAQLAELDSRVAFEVDYHADDFRLAWSVLMQGRIRLLDHAAVMAYEVLRRPPVPWPGSEGSLPIQFVPATVSGRSLQRRSPD